MNKPKRVVALIREKELTTIEWHDPHTIAG